MKLDKLETHDRLLSFQKQADYITEGCNECIRNRPEEFKNYPFYIFAHQRSLELDERIALYNQELLRCNRYTGSLLLPSPSKYKTLEDVPTARLIWEPRINKPKAQTNSMLFRAYPPTDRIDIIWMLPSRELWGQYLEDKLTNNSTICESIDKFINNRESLEKDEPDELPEAKRLQIMCEIGRNARARKEKPMPLI
jgi:hypothetical protein